MHSLLLTFETRLESNRHTYFNTDGSQPSIIIQLKSEVNRLIEVEENTWLIEVVLETVVVMLEEVMEIEAEEGILQIELFVRCVLFLDTQLVNVDIILIKVLCQGNFKNNSYNNKDNNLH